MTEPQARGGKAAATGPNRQTMHVLLVEDNPGDVRLIREMIRESGLTGVDLETSESLQLALKRLADGGIDAVLLDLGLPDSQGLDTLTRTCAEAPTVPIVVLTGLDDEESGVQAVQEGAQDYLAKSRVTGDLLVPSLRYAIERKKAKEELRKYKEHLEEMVEQRTRELRHAQEELLRKEKLAVLGQMAGGVGHELRNPLGVMANAVYFLKATLPQADETTRKYLEIIDSEVRNADKIITDLLDYARSKPAEREKTAVSDLVNQALRRYPPPQGVEVSTETAPDLPPVFADAAQIGQVLNNLLNNAYQAMPEGGKLTISADLAEVDPIRNPQSTLRIRVSDSGCGISRENMGKIFEPLFSTRTRGIGLGLTVSRNLAQANGGNMTVQSQEGKGSTFTLTLPTGEAP